MDNLILVTGSDGLVGSRFIELSKFKTELHLPKEVELNITNKSEIKAILSSFEFKAVINFAAYTDVGKAEEERNNKNGFCWNVNVAGVENLVEAVSPYKDKIHYVQISTDMVFPGNKNDPGPYMENHTLDLKLDDLTWYGYSKGRGERLVKETLGDSASIVRLIYPVRARYDSKLDYIRKPLSLFNEGKLYPLFDDQQISITFVDELCQVLDKIIEADLRGTYHVSSSDTTTPYELICYLVEELGKDAKSIKSIGLDDFIKNNNIPAYRYPKYGGLDSQATSKKLGLKFSSVRQIIDTLIAQGIE